MVTAQEMGKKGGSAKSNAKTTAARKNASLPRKKWLTAIAYELLGVEKHKAFGVLLVNGSPPSGALKCHEWLVKMVHEHGLGLSAEVELEFTQLASSSRRIE